MVIVLPMGKTSLLQNFFLILSIILDFSVYFKNEKNSGRCNSCVRGCCVPVARVQQRPERSGDRTRSSPTRTRTKNGLELHALTRFLLACVRGFEPPTFWSVAKRSIQLS